MIYKLVFLAAGLVALSGCQSSVGSFNGQSTSTLVTLGEGNYRMVKAGVDGESRGFEILSLKLKAPTFAEAKKDLYKNSKIDFSGRALALANQVQDVGKRNYLLFAFPTVNLNADIIEFTGDAEQRGVIVFPKDPTECMSLGDALRAKGALNKAEMAYREAVRLFDLRLK
jgi:hypothetical protein